MSKNKVNNVIILAAGKSLQLDGYPKVLIQHPKTGKTIMDSMIEAFEGKSITVVVGFCAIQIMQKYPNLNYVVNPNWAITNNAMSLGLALKNEPTYVVPGDIFIKKTLIDALDDETANLALTRNTENRVLSSIHAVTDQKELITDVYQGPVKDASHTETTGLFKLSDKEAIKVWKKKCLEHSNLFAGQLLPLEATEITSVDIGKHSLWEINTPTDYLNLMSEFRSR